MPTATINGINLHYEIEGEGPPVLFIHGLGSSGRDWSYQTGVLKQRFQCIAYDARGHGRSDKPPGPYKVTQHAADAFALLDHLAIQEVALVGLSMGGMIAFQMAVDAPPRLPGMVIINSGPHLVPATLAEHIALWQRLVLFRLFSMQKIGETVGKRLFPGPDQTDLRKTFAARWAENDKRAYMDATRGLVGWSVMPHLATMQTPTLVLAADQDYTPVAAKQAYVDLMPNAELVVFENARHGMTMDRAHEVNVALAAFLERVTQRAEPIRA